MFKLTRTDKVIGLIHSLVLLIFLRSTTPWIVLTAFIILCSYLLQANTDTPLPKIEGATLRTPEEKDKWPVIIITVLYRLLVFAMLGWLVWALINHKSGIFAGRIQ